MGWFSWLFGKEKGPPEPLVLGAKLRCPYGSQDSYLYVDSVGIDVNNLPKACVEDCKALHNIGSFGDCYAGGSCEKSMVLDEKWENPEPQGEKINGKEIITTKSLLSCRASGMEFKIINSGQDGIFAKQIILMQEMDEKYPGLREILDNPYGSLYLNEGKYELALQFIEDRMIKNGGKIELYTLYDKNNLEGEYIKGALGRLMPYCDTGALESLLNGMENSASKNKMDANADWDAHVINAEMIKLLKKDCKETKEQIETKPFYKWQEENKLFLSVAAEGVTNFAYGTLMYYSAIGSAGNTQSKGNKPAVKEKNGGSVTKGAGNAALKGGAGRSAQYSKSWGNASMKEVVNEIAPGSDPIVTDSGKIIYNNAQTGKQVVYDIEGNYLRVEDTTMTGKRVYTDVNGNAIPNNKVVNGKQSGISQGEYNQITHYNNTDTDFPYDMK